jgi:hypothetical protein
MGVKRLLDKPIGRGGLTYALPLLQLDDELMLIPASANQEMIGNIVITFQGTGAPGQRLRVSWSEGMLLGAHTFTINGQTISATQAAIKGSLLFIYSNGWKVWYQAETWRPKQLYDVSIDCAASKAYIEILEDIPGNAVLFANYKNSEGVLEQAIVAIISNEPPQVIEIDAENIFEAEDATLLITDSFGNYSNLIQDFNCSS